MKAVVLEKQHVINVREVPGDLVCGPGQLRIAPHTVGICGSDVHYYTHGRIGRYVVEAPMILGHEASGVVREVGEGVEGFAVGDRVAMEPGVPDTGSRAALAGMYNVDPAVRFWATPPVDGCLVEEVVHPAAFTYHLPDNVSFAEGALMEPLAVGMHAGHLREDIVAHDRCVRRNGYAAVALHQMRDVYQGTFVDRRGHVAHIFQDHMNGRQRSITATLA